VIVPTLNSGRTLKACLASVRAQYGVDVELIVVDNSSTDDTPGIARCYADVFASGGPERSAQRNYGASVAKGEYFLFVDSDMVLSPSVVVDCVTTIRKTNANAVIVPEQSTGTGFWAACRALEKSCYQGDDLVEAARFFPRRVFEEVGGFDETLTGPEDWDLTDRVAGGTRLPRSKSQIIHDEGAVGLRAAMAKKRYYASSFPTYWGKHASRRRWQSNPVFRKAYLRNWRRLVRHPILTAGFLVLKISEASGAAWGALVDSRRSANAKGKS
jgi:glycosyltransferase involved in cell wall biosynthesis